MMMSSRIKILNILVAFIIVFISIIPGLLSLIPKESVFAAVYQCVIRVTDTSGVDRTNVQVLTGISGTNLINAGYLDSPNGLKIKIVDGSDNVVKFMVDTVQIAFVIPTLLANATNVYTMYLNYTPAQTGYPVIVGEDGYITRADTAGLELGTNFDIYFTGTINTSTNGTAQTLFYKQDAAKLYISSPSNIKFQALTTGDTVSWDLDASGVSSGIHTIRITCNGSIAALYVDAVSKDTYSLTNYTQYSAGTFGGNQMQGSNQPFFYAQSRWWYFYMNISSDYHAYFRTSADNLQTWSAATDITGTQIANPFYVVPNAARTHVYYVRQWGSAVYFGRGALNSDGTITWGTEYNLSAVVGPSPGSGPIGIDSSDHVYFIFNNYGTNTFHLAKNANTDGTWANASGYPISAFWNSTTSYAAPFFIAGLSNTMLAYQTYAGYAAVAKYNNGTAWGGSYETIQASGATNFSQGSFDPDTGKFLVVGTYSSPHAYVWRRDVGGSWAAGQDVYSDAGGEYATQYDSIGKQWIIWYTHAYTGHYFKTYNPATAVISSEYTAGTGYVGGPFNATTITTSNGYNATIGHGTAVMTAYQNYTWSWTDSSYDWLFNQNNTASSTDTITMDVSGTRKMTWLPSALLSGTTIPDASGNSNTGTITWGTNHNLTISIGGITGDNTSVPTPTKGNPIPTAGGVPPLPYLPSWFGGCANITSLPFYETFNTQATDIGMSTCVLYFMMMMATVSALGLGVLLFTGSTVLTIGMMIIGLGASIGTTATPGFLMLFFIVLALGIYYISRQH